MNRTGSRLIMVAALLGAIMLTIGGCGKPKVERHSLSGRVTFQGKPVPVGLIVFEPDATQGNRGPQGYAEILDGQYHTDKIGKGAVLGAMNVEIIGYPAQNDASVDGNTPLFLPYKTKARITAETATLDFDVPEPKK